MRSFVCVLALAGTAAAGELDALKQTLVSGGDEEAAGAAAKIGASTDGKATAVLLDALALGGSPKVQSSIIEALGVRKDPKAFAVLVAYATNRTPEVRKRAVMALSSLPGDKMVPMLIERLGDPVEEVRGAAAAALGKRREKSAEPRLIKLFLHKDLAAATALGQMGTADLAHRISEMIGQVPDALLCQALGEMLKRPDFGPDPVRLEIVKTLSRVPGSDSTGTLIEYVTVTEKDKTRPSRVEAQRIVDERSGGQ
jgi:hypothetical protein